MSNKIEVRAAKTQEDVLDGECDVVETHHETIAAAKVRARHVLTDEFQQWTESASPLGYSQVLVNGECRFDYFRKGGA